MKTIKTILVAKGYIADYDLHKPIVTDSDELYDNLIQCEKLARKYHDKKLFIHTRIFITDYYIQVNDIEKALKIALENKKLAESEQMEEEQLKCYSGLLNIYHLLGDYSSMEELISVYREKLLNSNNLSKLCSLYIISAIQYHTLKNPQKCFEAYEKALQYAEKINNLELLLHTYNNYGFHALDYDLNLAYNLLTKTLQLIKDSRVANNLYFFAIANINLAEYYYRTGDYKKCNKYLDIGINNAKTIKNKSLILQAENKLCKLFIKLKKYDSAQRILLKNERNCLEKNNRDVLLSIYNNLHILFSEIGNYQSAYEYLLKYQQLNNDLFNEESMQKIRNLQITNEVKEIKLQRDHAEHLAHLKHDFLANMSHEIRTPINSILGICYLLQQDALNDSQRDYINRLENSSGNLLCLINEILDISKIEAGKLELVLAPFSFNKVLSDTLLSLQPKATEKGINLILDTREELDQMITGDAQRVSQILINIIANAIKFTPHGFVKISTAVSPAQDKANSIVITCTIKDTGIGIPEDKIQTIFERYEQAAAIIKTQFGGTGLGLAISKRLVDLMNGQISVTSELDKGTTFTILLPFTSTKIKPTSNGFPKIKNKRFLDNIEILLADDVAESRQVIREILLHFNSSIKITEAKNGKEVLELLQNSTPELLLMDLDMPEMNGFEVAAALRNNSTFFIPKIIAHTAGLLTLSKDEILELGFDDLLTKPFNPDELLHKLHRLLYKKTGT